MNMTSFQKGVAGMVTAAVILLATFANRPVEAQNTYRGVGYKEYLIGTNTLLTNVYVTSRKVDLQQFNGVYMYATCYGSNTTITNSLRVQWSPDASNWFNEYVLSADGAGATAQGYTPLDRVIRLVSTNNFSYGERFNRMMRYFRVQVNGNLASGTNFINVEAYPLNQ